MAQFSLYHTLQKRLGDQFPQMTCTKATLVHLSHTLEDLVLRHRIPALIFTGFQESSYWRKETERYRQLAEVAQHVCIFAGEKLPIDHPSTLIQVTLDQDDKLRQEWFLLILSQHFSVVLCGLDNLRPAPNETMREFETTLTFDPYTITSIINVLEESIAHYRPEKLAALQTARIQYQNLTSDPTLITMFIQEMLRFEEQLHRQLLRLAHAQQVASDHLRREKALTEMLIESSPAYFVALNRDQHVMLMNPPLLATLGFTLNEIIDQPFINFIAKQEQYGFRLTLQHLTERPDELLLGILMQHKKQRSVPVEWHFKSVWDDAGQLEYIFGLGLDLSDREAAHRQAMELVMERERVQMLQEFIGDASHDLRTPIANLQTSLYLLQAHADQPEKRQYYIDKVGILINHVQRLVEDLLSMSQLDQNSAHFNFRPLDLNQIVRDLVTANESIAQRKNHRLTLHDHPEPLMLPVDDVHFNRALTNLVTNAIAYTPDNGNITITLYKTERELVIEIADTGIGIAPEHLPHIFERFYRIDKSRRTDQGGTGLGLAITRKIVEAHAGTIDVTSTPQVGTTFTLRFPLPHELS